MSDLIKCSVCKIECEPAPDCHIKCQRCHDNTTLAIRYLNGLNGLKGWSDLVMHADGTFSYTAEMHQPISYIKLDIDIGAVEEEYD